LSLAHFIGFFYVFIKQDLTPTGPAFSDICRNWLFRLLYLPNTGSDGLSCNLAYCWSGFRWQRLLRISRVWFFLTHFMLHLLNHVK